MLGARFRDTRAAGGFDAGRAMARRGRAAARGCRWRGAGEVRGAPEQEELFQAVEQAREGGEDEGVDGGRQQGAILQGPLAGWVEGDRGAKGGVA